MLVARFPFLSFSSLSPLSCPAGPMHLLSAQDVPSPEAIDYSRNRPQKVCQLLPNKRELLQNVFTLPCLGIGRLALSGHTI